MLNIRKRPQGILSNLGNNPYENVDGIDVRNRDAVYESLKSKGLLDPTVSTPPIAAPQGTPPVPEAPRGLPQVPPSARSTDPWAKANVRRTLLDIGAAFGGAQTFGEGLGRAAGAIGSRMDQLQAEATPIRKAGVGPDGTFEAITDPVTGETTYQRIDAFKNAADEEREAEWKLRTAPTPEDTIDLRARAMATIRRLPPDQQAAAYQRLLYDPESFGNIDVNGMPRQWDPMWAEMTEGMGMTTSQAYQAEAREREYERKVAADRVRAQQAGERITISRNRPPPRRAAPASAKLPSGFILD